MAEDATLFVELDPFLIFQSASVAPSQILQNGLLFDLGDLPALECGNISITVFASCEAEMGQTHCVAVTATPNAPCPAPDEAWSGATVNVTGECTEEGTVFRIQNTGTATMTVPLQYIIVEDGVMLNTAPTQGPVLAAQEILTVELPDDEGSTYFIQTNQEPFSPGFVLPTAFLEGCSSTPGGTFSFGFTNLLFDGDDQDWYDQLCLPNTGAFDPNDKRAVPVGYGDDHNILPETPLEYTIRFQNTGTDTAFTVVLRDTLAASLDLATLRLGAASHDYTFALDSSGTLEIDFLDIMLPDSNVNLAASQGFITYTIAPRAGLPLQTRIENTAAIYFDFNDPIITNTTFHTIDTNFIRISTGLQTPAVSYARLSVFPNPAGVEP